MQYGAVVLCGGQSRRMGLSKAALPFGPESMLCRVVRLLREVTDHIVVAAGRVFDPRGLPPEVRIVVDRREGRGPLEGLYAGLSGLPEHVEAAYVSSCDTPRLVPAFAARMLHLLGDEAIAVPVRDGQHYPLAAVYRRDVLPHIEGLLAADRRSVAFLFDLVATRRVPAEALRDVDPELATLENLNRPSEYLAALARAGLTLPPDLLRALLAGSQRIVDCRQSDDSVGNPALGADPARPSADAASKPGSGHWPRTW